MMRFSVLHAIAAQRGDGLRPELQRLLEQSRAQVESRPMATGCIGNGHTGALAIGQEIVDLDATEFSWESDG